MVRISFPMLNTPAAWVGELDETGDEHKIDVSGVTIEAVAHGLSLVPRFSGGTSPGYSVAEHSVVLYDWLKRRGAGKPTLATALLHDCTEAMGFADSHGGLKKVMCPRLRTLEGQVFRAVWDRFVPEHQPADVKAYDTLLGNWEAVHFRFEANGPLPDPYDGCLPDTPEGWAPRVSYLRFLHCWSQLNRGQF